MRVTNRAGRLLSHNLRGRQVTFASQPFTELGVALTCYREVACADLGVGIFTGPEIRRRLLRQRAFSGKIPLGIRIDLSGPEQSCLGLIQSSGQPALEYSGPGERAQNPLFILVECQDAIRAFRLANGQIQPDQRKAHCLIVAGIEFQHPLADGDRFRQAPRLGEQLAQMLLGPHVRPRGYVAPEMAGAVGEEALSQTPLGLLHHLPHQEEAVLQRHGHHGDHQALSVGAIRVQLESRVGEAQSFHEITGLHRIVGQLLGAPLGVVLLPRVGPLREPAAAGQIRQARVGLVERFEFLAIQQSLNLIQRPLCGERMLEDGRRWRRGFACVLAVFLAPDAVTTNPGVVEIAALGAHRF